MNDPNPTIEPGPESVLHVPADTTSPEWIGRFRIERVLGQGGFGVVYLARDEQLSRPVAIKVPHTRLVAGEADAYLTEARTVASLDHPHIVPVFDVGSTEQFPCFVVSKYIDGIDLATQLNQSRLSLHEAVELTATVAEALHHAHKHGLVHRDIKPGNILLDKSGKPFVADFGLALREQDIGKGPQFAGTPAYMSPEQARSEGHRVDGRSDIFSLGVVLYELLTGKRPFMANSVAEVLEQIVSVESRPPRQLDDRIPKELDRICLKALSKRASDRYSTASDLADDLRHWSNLNASCRPQVTEPVRQVIEVELPEALSLTKVVFLCYASADKGVAAELCRHLESQGISCWIAPRDVTPGADYGQAVIQAIETTSVTLVLLSAHANASIHVTHEVERAASKRKRVIPVRLEDVRPGPSLELYLSTAQWVDARRLSSDQVAAQVALGLGREGSSPERPVSPALTPPITPSSDQRAVKIVPKGLRSFDATDADFFLELLPGPRDRDGLPDSIRFWKMRIEEKEADNTFSVALIYGPSGCGKSSLVKAGLLPRLTKSVTVVYVEATGEETEAHLLKGLRRHVAGLPGNLGLVESLAALRQGQFLASGQKVLLVLDQFEQWLHARRNQENTELVQALRQCDGGRVECIVMVRDDFWLAVSRFMQALEIRVLEGENSRLVDLFDLLHARKVLAEFGRAYGRLPDNLGQCSKEQNAFLDQAVSGLAHDGKVISVRLALFAEMVKGKTWTPATLKDVGGTEGVGVTFLEETFAASTAPPQHRLHQKAAQAVLKALLPESGTDIKGHMRSQQELLEASGYGSRPRDFDELLRILDGELRLITPTDPEGADGEGATSLPAGGKCYQLTHDYLVPSLRDWLARKQKETRRGRAELLLADRAAVWNARPENRQLPSLSQWLGIRWLTHKKDWTPPQRKMMRKATRFHLLRGFAFAACLLLLSWGAWEGYGRVHAQRLRDRLMDAPTSENVLDTVRDMGPYRRWLNAGLRDIYATAGDVSKDKLHASLALLPVDDGQVKYLHDRLLSVSSTPQEVVVIREALRPHAGKLANKLWEVVQDPKADPGQRLRAACALADYAPEDHRWETEHGRVVEALLSEHVLLIAQWAEGLRPVGKGLLPSLRDDLLREERGATDRGTIARLYRGYANEDFILLEKELDETAGKDATIDQCVALAKRQANAAAALAAMGRWEKTTPLLKQVPDPTLRGYLIDRLAPGGVEAKALVARLEEVTEPSVKQGLLLALGELGVNRLPDSQRELLLPQLTKVYEHHPDSGVHSAVGWLLRKWGKKARVEEIDQASRGQKPPEGQRWYVNGQLQTMVIVPQPKTWFWMGEGKLQHPRSIGRSFAISAREVTVAEFRCSMLENEHVDSYGNKPDCPINGVSWYDAAAYCNWLSKQEGIPEDQYCYLGKGKDIKSSPDYLKRTGYRLPTEAEWEYACRAGSKTTWSHGDGDELLAKYAQYDPYSGGKTHPGGSLRPNALGLFDMHGNVWEWCQDWNGELEKTEVAVTEDREQSETLGKSAGRMLRGGSFNGSAQYARSVFRLNSGPAHRGNGNGFRPARTFR